MTQKEIEQYADYLRQSIDDDVIVNTILEDIESERIYDDEDKVIGETDINAMFEDATYIDECGFSVLT
jgi:hypothetical protein